MFNQAGAVRDRLIYSPSPAPPTSAFSAHAHSFVYLLRGVRNGWKSHTLWSEIHRNQLEISWKSVGNQGKSGEISEKWKWEIKLSCARRFSAPYRSVNCHVVNYMADPAAARAHTSHSLRPAAGDSIMGLSVLWRMTTVGASKRNSSFGSVQI